MKRSIEITLLFLFLLNGLAVSAQQAEKPLSVGIFIYPGVEILDFSGPSEVFGSTQGFKPFLVAFKKEPLVSQRFITVTPQYSIEDCPPTDVLVFPGGNTGPMMDEPELIEWIRERAKTTQFMVSVCTGAGLLSKAGLLDGKEATTFHGFINNLQKMTPKATIHAGTRFVDNGQVITTAGVSAGIDGALHVVSRVKGEDVARATARYMEYDKWRPGEGKVIESGFLADIRKAGLEQALKNHTASENGIQPLYYQGEMINLAADLAGSDPAESANLYQWLIKKEGPTPAFYDGLGAAWKKMGKKAPIDHKTFLEKLNAGEVDWAKRTAAEVAKAYPDWMLYNEEDINQAGYNLYYAEKQQDAVAALKWNTELFPESANAWDSLSEAYEATGQNELAIKAGEKCLAKLPQSAYDENRKANLTKASKERLERLKGGR
ncbi:MAG TPA: DJ-1/PfpI family protein [Flavilitoribacter sp.]|nr:DJ-1/PfpI family protein [Flavilitoribacter sp.]HMQ89517.1 DJ-1/PfpI family protein [Flavilitoribacter sp.]